MRALRTVWLAASVEERIAAVIAAFAVFAVFMVGAWGIGGVFPDGHFASHANVGVIGLNMWRYHTVYAYWPFMEQAPPLRDAYMHHPLGLFWDAALALKIFGVHNWALRLPAVAVVTLTAFFVYRTGRAIWGPLEGALSAAAFVALPITLGFANYLDLEQPLMLGCIVATWGYARFRQTDRDIYAAASVAGFALATVHDWEAFIWGAAFLPFVFLRGFVIPPAWLGPADGRKLGRYWGAMVGVATVMLAVVLKMMVHADRVTDVFGSYTQRSVGHELPLAQVLKARHVRIELMFPGLAIALGKLAAPIMLARFILRRAELELLPVFLLFMAVVHYVHFKQGADVHIFWPHPFALYFALAAGVLAASVRDGWRWLVRRIKAPLPPFLRAPLGAGLVGAVVVGLPVMLVARDGASLIRLSRESGGRFMEVDAPSEVDNAVALHWFLAGYPATERIAFHSSIPKRWNTSWELGPRQVAWQQPLSPANPRLYMLDARVTSEAELREAARRYHVRALGWLWLIDRGAPPGPLDGFSWDEHDPNLFESFWYGATEPVRRVVADPWVTWEWRTLLAQPAVAPTGAPGTPEQLRIAHNIAVAGKDAAAAARWRRELVARLELPVTGRLSPSLELLGVAHHRGAARSFTPYLLAGPGSKCGKISIRAHVTGGRLLSTLPVDPDDHDIAPPPPIRCELWQDGNIYAVPTVYRHRAGHETFTLSGPGAPRGSPGLPLAKL
ncbi:MAG TPA: glycosyltransferase family 39 protein [Polyangia bacterium]|jgi:4-amino-4-deoxy-L-arabinose transferase-like glycosyltransferase